MLIQTFEPQNKSFSWSTVDDRLLQKPGCIVDIGCRDWIFASPFIGRKRIVGADPNEEAREGTEIFKGCVGDRTGDVMLTDTDFDSSTFKPERATATKTVPMLSWSDFIANYSIDDICLLKMNIEGGEYSLLSSMSDEQILKIDQMAISFHDWTFPECRSMTEHALKRLINLQYSATQTHEWGWWLMLKL